MCHRLSPRDTVIVFPPLRTGDMAISFTSELDAAASRLRGPAALAVAAATETDAVVGASGPFKGTSARAWTDPDLLSTWSSRNRFLLAQAASLRVVARCPSAPAVAEPTRRSLR